MGYGTEKYGELYWSGRDRGVRNYGGIITDLKMLTASIHVFIELELRGLGKPKKHLDVGGGMGHLVKNIGSPMGVNLDLSRYGLEHSVTTNNVRGDSKYLPFPPNYFDLITCVDVLEHVSEEIIPMVMAELKRVLAYNGRIFAVPATLHDRKIDSDETHVTKITPNEWRQIFTKAGFNLDDGLLTMTARRLGYFQPARLIPFPTIRTGLFILENPNRLLPLRGNPPHVFLK